MRKIFFMVCFFIFIHTLYGQDDRLMQYIREGLEKNLALQQKEFSLQQSILELREARGKFLPSIGIEARYSRAGGGRIIEFPVGDLMNPVYDAINITRIQTGQTPIPFPRLENERIPFLREEEHETKIRAIQPIFQPLLYFNQKIKADLKNAREFEVLAYKRMLIAEIKNAYFSYLKAGKVVHLFEQTMHLLEENMRINEKLVQQGMANKEVIYRAQAEISKMEQDLHEAVKNEALARAYFNHLLNRSLDSAIEVTDSPASIAGTELLIEDVRHAALNNREELKQLQEYIDVANSSKGMASSAFLPGVVVVADYGYQGETYRFKNEDDFWMVSGVLQWNLFNGFQDQTKRQIAQVEKQKLIKNLQETERLIMLQAQEAFYNLDVARKGKITAEDRLEAARQSYQLIKRKYEEGLASQIEYMDARNTLTSAEVFHVLSQYDYLIRSAELERVAGLWQFKQD